MLAVQRRSATLELLGRRDAATVEELAAHLRVSLSTVRRDLDLLEREGAVQRVHGGALLSRAGNATDVVERSPADREVDRREDKQAIARAAVELIVPGSTLLVSGGTTTAAMVPLLGGLRDVTVVTNSLDIAHRLAGGDLDVIVLGGSLRRPELSLLGHLVRTGVHEIHVDHVMMGAYALDPRSGALGASAQEVETDRTLARSAARLTIVADASKFARRSPHRIARIEDITEVVTSAGAPAADVATLRDRGVDVRVA